MTDLLDYLRSGTARGYLTPEEAFTVLSRHLEVERESNLEEVEAPALRSVRTVADPETRTARLNKDGSPRKVPGRKPKAKTAEEANPNGAQ